jgi:predicted RNase H-like nuclease (RuvC/YqgF family)
MSDAFPSDPPATILAIGVAGRVANAALAASPARVLAIVEPRPGEAAAIGRALASDSRVRLVQAMPALASGTVGLTQYSVPGLYSTREPLPALRTLYPGLQTRASAEVEALDMARLLDRLGSLPDPIELWLSAPGSELEILNGLERTGLLGRLSGIQLHGSAEPLFEGAEPAARLQGWLEGHHFRLTEMHESDPDWPLLVLRADTERRELIARADALVERLAVSGEAIAERNRKIAGLETGLAEKARKIDALTAEVAGLRTAVAERDADRARLAEQDREIDALTAARAAEAEATAERNRKIAGLETGLAEKAREIDALTAEVAGLRTAVAERDADRARLAEQDREIDALTAARAAEAEATAERNRKIAGLETGLAEKAREIDALTAEVAGLRTAVAERDADRARLAEQDREIDALTAARAAEAEANAERNRKTAGLETGLAEKAREIDALTAEVAGLRTAVAERDKRIDELDKSATEGWKVAREAQDVAASVRSDLSIALRMQALAQSDLRAVEERYKVAEQARSKQATLLQKLTPRLQQAAQQLQVMAQNDEAARLESEPATKRERGKKPKSGKKRSGGAGT